MVSSIIENVTKTYTLNKMVDVEYVNPREYLKDFHIKSIVPSLIKIAELKLHLPPQELKEEVLRQAELIVEKHLLSIEQMSLPSQIESILSLYLSKKEQLHLLKDISISKEQLGAIFVQAGAIGYVFSNYVFEGIPKSYKESDLPTFIRIKDDGDVESYGNRMLSNGQLKDIVLQSKKIIARFLDRGGHWHCFYQTIKGVYGNEHGKRQGNLPHIHYISDSFGVSREDFIKGLKGGQVPASVHIILTE